MAPAKKKKGKKPQASVGTSSIAAATPEPTNTLASAQGSSIDLKSLGASEQQ